MTNVSNVSVTNSCQPALPTQLDQCLQSIGTMRSVFNKKNGTARQSAICPESKGFIELNKNIFNNPEHSITGIEQFSHIWILYYFHRNTNKRCPSKVRPPRLNGQACGVFASRSPHRPNPIGLTLAKLESVDGGFLYVSGIDILDGTPIVDIKPYIPQYDSPKILTSESEQSEDPIEQSEDKADQQMEHSISERTVLPDRWVEGSVVSNVSVEFTAKSLEQLKRFHKLNETDRCDYCLKHFTSFDESKNAITNLLSADPRSVYRRNKCVDRLYYFTIDSIHITCWFDIETNAVQVVKVKPFVDNKSTTNHMAYDKSCHVNSI